MAATYEIVTVIERTDITPKGEFIRVYEITAKTKPHGIEFTMLMPEAEFTKEKAAALLDKKAKDLEALYSL
jgi:hypothetical protein